MRAMCHWEENITTNLIDILITQDRNNILLKWLRLKSWTIMIKKANFMCLWYFISQLKCNKIWYRGYHFLTAVWEFESNEFKCSKNAGKVKDLGRCHIWFAFTLKKVKNSDIYSWNPSESLVRSKFQTETCSRSTRGHSLENALSAQLLKRLNPRVTITRASFSAPSTAMSSYQAARQWTEYCAREKSCDFG